MNPPTIDFIKRQTKITPMNPDLASAKTSLPKPRTKRALMGFKQFIEERDKLLSDLR